MYFAYDLPKAAPSYLDPSFVPTFVDTVNTVSQRMEKLEQAKNIYLNRRMDSDAATFAMYAKRVFDSFGDQFEAMIASELADMVTQMASYSNEKAEPRLEWPNAVTVVDTAFVRTSEWEALRHIGIGGSDSSVVLGVSPYRTKLALYMDKRGFKEKIIEKGKEGVFKRGHILEDDVIDTFCIYSGAHRVPETRMFRSKEFPDSTANIDAIIRMPDGGLYVFEAKTTIEENWNAWAGDNIPIQYISQTRQYPAVLNDDRIKGTYIGCLFTKDYSLGDRYVGSTYDGARFTSKFVERDPEQEREILEAEANFMNRYMRAETPPPTDPTDIDSEIETLRTYSGPADKSLPPLPLNPVEYMDAASALGEIAREKKELNEQLRRLDEREAPYKRLLIEALGTCVEGRIYIDDDSYYEVKYAPRKGTSVDLELLKSFYPDAYAKCVEVLPEKSRTFTMKVKKTKKGR